MPKWQKRLSKMRGGIKVRSGKGRRRFCVSRTSMNYRRKSKPPTKYAKSDKSWSEVKIWLRWTGARISFSYSTRACNPKWHGTKTGSHLQSRCAGDRMTKRRHFWATHQTGSSRSKPTTQTPWITNEAVFLNLISILRINSIYFK